MAIVQNYSCFVVVVVVVVVLFWSVYVLLFPSSVSPSKLPPATLLLASSDAYSASEIHRRRPQIVSKHDA